MNIELLSS